jgi:hypothetical protein
MNLNTIPCLGTMQGQKNQVRQKVISKLHYKKLDNMQEPFPLQHVTHEVKFIWLKNIKQGVLYTMAVPLI